MPQIRMKDGSVVGFPDEMPREQISAMIRMKYPEDDTGKSERIAAIRAGNTIDTARPTSGKGSGTLADRARDLTMSGVTGLLQGGAALAGLPGRAQDLMEAGGKKIARSIKGMSPIEYEAYMNNLPDDAPEKLPEKLRQKLAGYIPRLPNMQDTMQFAEKMMPRSMTYEPDYALGTGVQRVANFAVGSPVKGFTKGVVAPALGSIVGEKAAKDTKLEPYGGLLGALGGMAAAPTLMKVGGRMVSPLATGAENAAHAKVLEDAGIRVSAGQKTGSKVARFFEDASGGDFNEKQLEDLTQYAASHVGSKARRLDPAELEKIDARISGEFDTLGKATSVVPDPKFGGELRKVMDEYHDNTGEAFRKPIVRKLVGDIVAAGTGPKSASVYQKIRSNALKVARGAGADSDLRNAMNGIAHAVDEVMERSITDPELLGRYRTVRGQYKELQRIEDALSMAGEDAKKGLITPAAYERAVKKGLGKKNWNRAKGDPAAVSRAAGALLKPLANSNTAMRANVIRAAGGLGGYASGEDTGDSLMRGAIGLVAPNLLARALLSKPGRKLVGNQLGAGFANTRGNIRTVGAPIAAHIRKLLGP